MMRNIMAQVINDKLACLKQTSYDSAAGMFKEEFHGRLNYHTSVTDGVVHSVNFNADVMPALMASADEEDKKIALNILTRLLQVQDKDYDSRAYGIWPYLFEESFDDMKHPDWNWASFIGRTLLVMELEFGSELSEEIRIEIKEALFRACESIERRNMGVDYTNISLMSSFVLVKTGELYGENYYYAKGIRNLKRQLDFVQKNGGFCEYNSPDYGVIDIDETGRMRRYFASEEAKELAEQLHFECWKVFAYHYHAKTGQIAPPHTRCYADIKDSYLRSILYIGTKGRCLLRENDKIDIGYMAEFADIECPEELVSYFTQEGTAGTLVESFYKGYDPLANEEVRVLLEKGMPSLTSHTYLHPDYCLGSFKEHDMWNQRRPVMAYIEGPEGTVCYRTRCLHDGMDFASTIHTAAQEDGRLTGGIHFVKDHGDYHYILTPLKDESIITDTFCVEFAVTGAVKNVQLIKRSDDCWILDIGNVSIRLQILEAVFGEEKVQLQVIDEADKKGIRLVLFAGEQRCLNFGALDKAYIIYALEVAKKGEEVWNETCLPVEIEKEAGGSRVRMRKKDGAAEQIYVAAKPGNYMKPFPGLRKMFKNGGFFYYDER